MKFLNFLKAIKEKFNISSTESSFEYDKTIFQEFDECLLDGVLGGCTKEFLRCSGSHLERMYEDILSGHNNYVVCVDKNLHDPRYTKKMFKSSYVSGVLKFNRPGMFSVYCTTAEIIGSRIAELLGLKTAYVAPVGDPKDEKDLKSYISVDFLQGQEILSTLSDYTNLNYLNSAYGIRRWMPIVSSVIQREIPDEVEDKQEIANQFIADFINLFVIKGLILADRDFRPYNVGIVHNSGELDYRISPAFDYELCLIPWGTFPRDIDEATPIDGVSSTIKYLNKYYPQVLDDIVARLRQDGLEDRIKKIIDEYAPDSRATILMNTFKTQNNYFLDEYDRQIKKRPQKQIELSM